jgi:hypothetical protein
MIDPQHVLHRFHRSVTQIARRATSAAITVGVLALTSAVRPMEAQPQAAVRVPASVLERYVGEYLYPDGQSTFVVSRMGDTLFHVSASQRFAYQPISQTKFAVGTVVTAEFVIDEAGGVTQILSDGVGLEHRLRRRGSPPERPAASPTPAAAVRVPRSVLERYVGTYEFIPGQMDRTDLRMVVRLEGDKLIRDGGGVGSYILTPLSETRFMLGNNPAFVVEFVVDDAGVTQVMGSGHQQLLARLTSKR